MSAKIDANGIILKGIGGFYYVEVNDKIYECKARGIFKQKGIKPLPGDRVSISINDGCYNTIENIHERKNYLERPTIANLDRLFVFISMCDPKPNLLVTDKLIAIAIKCNIEPVIIITKCDLDEPSHINEIYATSGFEVFNFSLPDKSGLSDIKDSIKNGVFAFAGNSGVGKSSLLNSLFPKLDLKTGITSKKLGRGRHTTREVELFKISENTYIADSPGFSSIDLIKHGIDDKNELQYLFPEFSEFIGKCKFTSCSHTTEKGCKILSSIENGKINKQRHDSYVSIYNELKDIKKW